MNALTSLLVGLLSMLVAGAVGTLFAVLFPYSGYAVLGVLLVVGAIGAGNQLRSY